MSDTATMTEGEKLERMADEEARRSGIDIPEREAKPEGEASPEGKGSLGDPEKPVVEKEDEKENMVPQSRVDEIVAERNKLAKEAEELRIRLEERSQIKKESEAPNDGKPKDYTDDELREIAEKYPEHRNKALEMLEDRRIDRKVEERMKTRDKADQDKQQTEKVVSEANTIWSQLTKDNPDLEKRDSDLYKLANAEYQKIPNRGSWPGAMENAVAVAKGKLLEKKSGSLKSEQARVEAARVKGITPLGGAARAKASESTSSAQLQKLHAEALKTDFPSSEWLKYQRAAEAAEKAKSKKED